MTRAKQVIRYWCGHANGEVRSPASMVTEPFGLDAPLSITYQDEFSQIFIGHRRGGETLHGFFNGGLTLVQADHNHGSVIEDLRRAVLQGLVALPRAHLDPRRRDQGRALRQGHGPAPRARARAAARAGVRRARSQVRAAWPREPDAAAERLQRSTRRRPGTCATARAWPAPRAAQACARSPSGRIWTWSELRKAASEGAVVRERAPPLSDAVEALDHAVLASYGGHQRADPRAGHRGQRDATAAALPAARVRDRPGRAHGSASEWFMPLAPEPGERAPVGGARGMATRLLDDSGSPDRQGRVWPVRREREPAARAARRSASASLVRPRRGRRRRARAPGLFSRRRALVVDADHPTVRTLLGPRRCASPSWRPISSSSCSCLLGGSIAHDTTTRSSPTWPWATGRHDVQSR